MTYELTDADPLVLGRVKELSEQTGSDINVMQFVKGNEKYVFLYSDENEGECLRTVETLLQNSEFDYWDVAYLSLEIRLKGERKKKAREKALEEGKRFKNRLEGFF